MVPHPPAGVTTVFGRSGTVVAQNNDYFNFTDFPGQTRDDWDLAFARRLQWDGGATNLDPATGRISLGATDVGNNIFILADTPGSPFICGSMMTIQFPRERLHRSPSILALLLMFPQEQQSMSITIMAMIRPGRASQILPFKTLAVAFTHALSGGVIYVSPGTYDQGTTALGDSIQRHGGRIRSRFKHYHR